MEIKKHIKRFNVWVRRKVHLPLFIIAVIIVLLLIFNEDTNLMKNRQYDEEIKALTEEIKLCKDSAAYYKAKHDALLTNREDLERVAREQYNMQRSTEDVYIIKE